MIRRVRIRNYKSLKDVEIALQPLTVIIGPNAAGKSNLFDALGLLSRMVTSPTLSDAFREHRGAPLEAFHYGEHGLEAIQARASLRFDIEVDVELAEGVVQTVEERIHEIRKGLPESRGRPGTPRHFVTKPLLRYALGVEILVNSGHLRVASERLVALDQDGREDAGRQPFIEPIGNRLRLRLEGQARPTEPEIGLDRTLVSTPLYPPHYPHISAFKEELARWRFYYFDPATMRNETPLKHVETLGPYGADLAAFFNTLKATNPRQFDAMNRALRSLLPSVSRIDMERTPEGLLRLQVYEGDVPFSARVISEGTLRVLGLLAITHPLAPTTVVGYEEPENGIHPRRLQLVAELLKNAALENKQILVNTHSPKLPEYFADEALIECRKADGVTLFRPLRVYGPLLRPQQIEEALDETSLMERTLRGDFGG